MSPIEALVWALFFYFSPSIVAYFRQSGWRALALFTNVFFGWTIIGWFVAWFLAFHARTGGGTGLVNYPSPRPPSHRYG